MKRRLSSLLLVLLAGCAGLQRDCASGCNSAYGADWVVVQYPPNAAPNCWVLKNVAVANEQSTDGIFWQDSKTGHLVHVAGAYARVQVQGGDFAGAANLLGLKGCLVEGR